MATKQDVDCSTLRVQIGLPINTVSSQRKLNRYKYMHANELILKKAVETITIISELVAMLHETTEEKKSRSTGRLALLKRDETLLDGNTSRIDSHHLPALGKKDGSDGA